MAKVTNYKQWCKTVNYSEIAFVFCLFRVYYKFFYFYPNVSFHLCNLCVRITLALWYRYIWYFSFETRDLLYKLPHCITLHNFSERAIITEIFSFAWNRRWMSLVHNLSPNTIPLILSQSLICLWMTLSSNKVQTSTFFVKNQHATNRLFTEFIMYIIHCFHCFDKHWKIVWLWN